jgi:hypothetical protein
VAFLQLNIQPAFKMKIKSLRSLEILQKNKDKAQVLLPQSLSSQLSKVQVMLQAAASLTM